MSESLRLRLILTNEEPKIKRYLISCKFMYETDEHNKLLTLKKTTTLIQLSK